MGFCTEVVLACAFLHNVCLTHGEVFESEVDEDAAPPHRCIHQIYLYFMSSAAQFRDRLAAQISAPICVQFTLMDHDYTQWFKSLLLFDITVFSFIVNK